MTVEFLLDHTVKTLTYSQWTDYTQSLCKGDLTRITKKNTLLSKMKNNFKNDWKFKLSTRKFNFLIQIRFTGKYNHYRPQRKTCFCAWENRYDTYAAVTSRRCIERIILLLLVLRLVWVCGIPREWQLFPRQARRYTMSSTPRQTKWVPPPARRK